MGLDISHDCWTGAYSAFMRWRAKLAEVAGIPPLHLMEYFFERGSAYDPFLKHAEWMERINMDQEAIENLYSGIPIRWSSLKPDILHILLTHSDCEGEIESSMCDELADRLEELLPLLPEGTGGGHVGVWKEKTQIFIKGLRLAAYLKESIIFS